MNAKIIELWGKASVSTKDNSWESQKAFIERFAESIVLECEVALSPMLRDMISRGHAVDLIKRHFGVRND
jgi:hypothetical protein